MKGIELGTLKRMSEVIVEVADVPRTGSRCCPGPNLAREIAAGSRPPRWSPAATTTAPSPCSTPA